MSDVAGSILVVDDIEASREVVGRTLQRHGYEAVSAAGGREALQQVADRAFDLVLLDIVMPEIDGLEVLRSIRHTHAPDRLPVIMLTARDQPADMVQALNLGANDYLTKPLDLPVALARIRTQIALKRAAASIQRQAEELGRSNAELEQFAYVASHDLRAPLRAIANLSEWIEEDLENGPVSKVREHLELLRGRVGRMEGLIDGLLAYARAGRLDDRITRVDTAQLLADAIFLLDPPSNCQVHVGPGMPVFDTAPTPLTQVFSNLIGNAIKHHDRDTGRVEVEAADAGDCWRFTVSDDGPGIPGDMADRVFEMFQTLRPRDEVEGSGMGLALVRKIVEAAGGAIECRPGRERGSVFQFTWPKSVDDVTRGG
ncbi:MAG: response regulator [Phycisphaerae bacterium]|nr:response regulator [Phycisphaerae bacterium]